MSGTTSVEITAAAEGLESFNNIQPELDELHRVLALRYWMSRPEPGIMDTLLGRLESRLPGKGGTLLAPRSTEAVPSVSENSASGGVQVFEQGQETSKCFRG